MWNAKLASTDPRSVVGPGPRRRWWEFGAKLRREHLDHFEDLVVALILREAVHLVELVDLVFRLNHAYLRVQFFVS